MLYFRMLLTMAVALYTSRVVLQSLGVTDYGVYNVVGGIVSMFGFLNGALSGATQRFLTFTIAENNVKKTNEVFCTSVLVHAMLSIIILVLAETIGLWFLNAKMNIPADRMVAANWVYQFSIISAVVMFMSVPYNALIIAHERMSAFAYISIIEVILKLAVAFAIMAVSGDRLIVYAFLILSIQVTIRLIYGRYCKKHFTESQFHFAWNKAKVKEMTSFAGWSLIGSLASVLSTQGENILLNIFFGPIVNAARGVAVQVQSAVLNFCTNFQMAVNPQITKTYAVGELNEHHKLIVSSAKFSALLVMILSTPIIIYTPEILSVWLKEVPNYTVQFIRIIMLTSIVDSTMGPFIVSIRSYGKIRNSQILQGSIILLIIPISYILLLYFRNPQVVLWVHLCIAILAQMVRIILTCRYVQLKFVHVVQIYVPFLISLCLTIILSYLCKESFFSYSIINTIVFCAVSVLLGTIISLIFGMSKSEKQFVKATVLKHLHKK
jgi:O-antigen/teichoic acid export membrane protein